MRRSIASSKMDSGGIIRSTNLATPPILAVFSLSISLFFSIKWWSIRWPRRSSMSDTEASCAPVALHDLHMADNIARSRIHERVIVAMSGDCLYSSVTTLTKAVILLRLLDGSRCCSLIFSNTRWQIYKNIEGRSGGRDIHRQLSNWRGKKEDKTCHNLPWVRCACPPRYWQPCVQEAWDQCSNH